MKKAIIILFSVLLLGACTIDEVPFQYTICVKIMDKDEETPVKNADVYLYSVVGSTLHKIDEQHNVNGECKFPNLLKQTGKYAVRVKCEPLYNESPRKDITLSELKLNPVNISLEKR
jgi:5-hydroxyisourate hydrolase-like protein (transthyretin family)